MLPAEFLGVVGEPLALLSLLRDCGTAVSGTALHLQEGAVAVDSIVAVTLEPEAGSEQPTTTPLFAAGA